MNTKQKTGSDYVVWFLIIMPYDIHTFILFFIAHKAKIFHCQFLDL